MKLSPAKQKPIPDKNVMWENVRGKNVVLLELSKYLYSIPTAKRKQTAHDFSGKTYDEQI